MKEFWNFLNQNEGTTWTAVVGFFLTLLVLVISSCDKHNTRIYAQNGYEQVQKQGSTDTMWVKKR